MRLSISLKAVTFVAATLVPFTALTADDCPCKCIYPVSDPKCINCCFHQEGTVAATSETSVTIEPPSSGPNRSPKTFEIRPDTKVQGKVASGEHATVYYHKAGTKDVATQVDILGFLPGELTPGNAPTPPDPCHFPQFPGAREQTLPPNTMRAFLGNSMVFSTGNRIVALRTGEDDILVLRRVGTGMFVSAKLFKPNGQLAAEIVDNHFFINPRDSFQIRQAGAHSLEILDPQGDKVLNLEFLNPTTLSILGNVYGPRGQLISIGRETQRVGSNTLSAFCFGDSAVALTIQ